MSGLTLDFMKFVHAPDKFFPHGRMFIEEDERGHFIGVETRFLVDGKLEEPQKLSFYDRGPDALKQFALLKTYCEAAAESAIASLGVTDSDGSFYLLSHQISHAEFGAEIFGKAIANTFVSDWSDV